jgi:hypothetical protein
MKYSDLLQLQRMILKSSIEERRSLLRSGYEHECRCVCGEGIASRCGIRFILQRFLEHLSVLRIVALQTNCDNEWRVDATSMQHSCADTCVWLGYESCSRHLGALRCSKTHVVNTDRSEDVHAAVTCLHNIGTDDCGTTYLCCLSDIYITWSNLFQMNPTRDQYIKIINKLESLVRDSPAMR